MKNNEKIMTDLATIFKKFEFSDIVLLACIPVSYAHPPTLNDVDWKKVFADRSTKVIDKGQSPIVFIKSLIRSLKLKLDATDVIFRILDKLDGDITNSKVNEDEWQLIPRIMPKALQVHVGAWLDELDLMFKRLDRSTRSDHFTTLCSLLKKFMAGEPPATPSLSGPLQPSETACIFPFAEVCHRTPDSASASASNSDSDIDQRLQLVAQAPKCLRAIGTARVVLAWVRCFLWFWYDFAGKSEEKNELFLRTAEKMWAARRIDVMFEHGYYNVLVIDSLPKLLSQHSQRRIREGVQVAQYTFKSIKSEVVSYMSRNRRHVDTLQVSWRPPHVLFIASVVYELGLSQGLTVDSLDAMMLMAAVLLSLPEEKLVLLRELLQHCAKHKRLFKNVESSTVHDYILRIGAADFYDCVDGVLMALCASSFDTRDHPTSSSSSAVLPDIFLPMPASDVHLSGPWTWPFAATTDDPAAVIHSLKGWLKTGHLDALISDGTAYALALWDRTWPLQALTSSSLSSSSVSASMLPSRGPIPSQRWRMVVVKQAIVQELAGADASSSISNEERVRGALALLMCVLDAPFMLELTPATAGQGLLACRRIFSKLPREDFGQISPEIIIMPVGEQLSIQNLFELPANDDMLFDDDVMLTERCHAVDDDCLCIDTKNLDVYMDNTMDTDDIYLQPLRSDWRKLVEKKMVETQEALAFRNGVPETYAGDMEELLKLRTDEGSLHALWTVPPAKSDIAKGMPLLRHAAILFYIKRLSPIPATRYLRLKPSDENERDFLYTLHRPDLEEKARELLALCESYRT